MGIFSNLLKYDKIIDKIIFFRSRKSSQQRKFSKSSKEYITCNMKFEQNMDLR